jgi:hypothetical protein
MTTIKSADTLLYHNPSHSAGPMALQRRSDGAVSKMGSHGVHFYILCLYWPEDGRVNGRNM